ncbi:MAG: transposase [Planctomycetota bacterium]
MPGSRPHRKLVKHFDDRDEIHELTFSCYRRLPLLDDQWRRQQLSLSIDRATSKHGWRLAAFVFMPEHVHLLTYPTQSGARVDQLLFAIKRPFSYRVKQQFTRSGDSLLRELTIRQRPGKKTFRFWQEGRGYDRNVRTEQVVLAAIDYLHLNPVRRGLAGRAVDYRWSSARWYVSEGAEVSPELPKLSAVPPEWFADRSDVTSYKKQIGTSSVQAADVWELQPYFALLGKPAVAPGALLSHAAANRDNLLCHAHRQSAESTNAKTNTPAANCRCYPLLAGALAARNNRLSECLKRVCNFVEVCKLLRLRW